MTTPADILTTLRDAAEQGDWNACHDAAETELSRLPVPKILKLAHREDERRLPVFERHHLNEDPDAECLYVDALVTIIATNPKAIAAEIAAWNRLADELAAALDVAG